MDEEDRRGDRILTAGLVALLLVGWAAGAVAGMRRSWWPVIGFFAFAGVDYLVMAWAFARLRGTSIAEEARAANRRAVDDVRAKLHRRR